MVQILSTLYFAKRGRAAEIFVSISTLVHYRTIMKGHGAGVWLRSLLFQEYSLW